MAERVGGAILACDGQCTVPIPQEDRRTSVATSGAPSSAGNAKFSVPGVPAPKVAIGSAGPSANARREAVAPAKAHPMRTAMAALTARRRTIPQGCMLDLRMVALDS